MGEFTIVEALDNIPSLPPGCFALVSKVHHAAIDGMSGVAMSAAVHDHPDAYAAALRQSFAALKAGALQPASVPPVEVNDNKRAPTRATRPRRGAT